MPALAGAALALVVGIGVGLLLRPGRAAPRAPVPEVAEPIERMPVSRPVRALDRPPPGAVAPRAPSPLVAPVGAAPSAEPPLTADQERANEIRRLRESGPDSGSLLTLARNAGEALRKTAAAAKINADLGDWECHASGCFATLTHHSNDRIDDLTTEFSRTDEFRSWNGPKMRSGPIIREPGGIVEVTWFLYSPESS